MSTSALSGMTQGDLDERAQQLEAQIVSSGSAVLDVICMDLSRYLEREAKRRFVEHVDFSTSMNQQTLVSLRKTLGALGNELGTSLQEALSGSSAWVIDRVPDDRKSLRGNGEVWVAIQAVACRLSGVLEQFGFPPDQGPDGPAYVLEYDTPKYFIDRAYCPGLIEAYWKQVEELGAVRQTLAMRSRNESQEALGARWDAID